MEYSIRAEPFFIKTELGKDFVSITDQIVRKRWVPLFISTLLRRK